MTTQPNAGGGSLAQDALGRAGGGASVAAATADRPTISPDVAADIFRATDRGKVIARRFGISQSTVSKIKRRLIHREATRPWWPEVAASHMNAMLVSLACTGSLT